jgi:predicted DNA-binding transcriptional regulator YafY
MPLIKNAVARYYLIDECLTHPHHRYWTLEEILEKGEERDIIVSKRTLELDIQAMRYDDRLRYYAPISYCKKNKGFYYTDQTYSVTKLPLTVDDIQWFEVMIDSLQRFRGAEILHHVEGIFDKLEKVVGHLKTNRSKSAYPVVAFEKIPYSKGMEHFDVLYRAILKQTPLRITYQKFEGQTPSVHVFHPYLLKEYKFRWYVLGFSETRRSKLILALDRIEGIVKEKMEFKPAKGLDVQKYFDHTIGVTITHGSVKEIRLWFSVKQGNYIKTQHLHETQRIVSDTKEGLIVTLQLIPNYELLQLLLSFGPEVHILEPQTLQQELKTMLEKNLKLYEHNEGG